MITPREPLEYVDRAADDASAGAGPVIDATRRRVAGRLPLLARCTHGIPIPVPADVESPGDPAAEATPADLHRSPRGTEAAARAARRKMRAFLARCGSRGATVTRLADVAGVDRDTVRGWLAEDTKHGRLERVAPGIYRTRQHSDRGSGHHSRRGR